MAQPFPNCSAIPAAGAPRRILAHLPARRLVVAALAAGILTRAWAGEGSVAALPPPEPAAEYTVSVNGRPVTVHRAETRHFDHVYYFASFDVSGPTQVTVASGHSLAGATLLPASAGIAPTRRSAGTLGFEARRPFKLSIERDGRNSPLLLFGNAPEENAPRPGDAGVIYFGPGIHRPGRIRLGSNQTLYVADGAVVKGGIDAHGENIRILGRGIIDGSDYPHADGPTPFMVLLDRCRNVVVRDVILRGSWLFTLVPAGCDGVTIDNVKICGSRVLNDDGIDPCNSSQVSIRDCFVRSDDDCVAVKGLGGFDRKPCEDITITDCLFWVDRACVFRIGYECETNAMQDLVARNIDILHFASEGSEPPAKAPTSIFYFQPSNGLSIRRMTFEDVRIHADGQDAFLAKLRSERRGSFRLPAREGAKLWQASDTWQDSSPGGCDAIVFRNVVLSGQPGSRRGFIYLAGSGPAHPIENVTFDHVVRFGRPTVATSEDVTIDHDARNIRFVAPR